MAKGVLDFSGPYSLGLTLLCGQCFRWERPDPDGWFTGVAGQAFWRIRQDGKHLFWECSSPNVRGQKAGEWLYQYLHLDDDLESWVKTYQDHPVLQNPIRLLKGLRILRQEPWECTLSFMFAQGLSVKVIRQALWKFCVEYAKPVVRDVYAFPEPEVLSRISPDDLKPFTNNYRARAERIIRMAHLVEEGFLSLDNLKNVPCDEARETLMALDGIGPKIADCILLFSLDQESAFPVDRWVLRAMKRHFRTIRFLGKGEEAPTRRQYFKISQRARKTFGKRCGIASEYLFLYLRMSEDQKLQDELAPYCQKIELLSTSLI